MSERIPSRLPTHSPHAREQDRLVWCCDTRNILVTGCLSPELEKATMAERLHHGSEPLPEIRDGWLDSFKQDQTRSPTWLRRRFGANGDAKARP